MQACPKDRQREEISSVKTLYQGGSGEIVEKKSRFIATTEKIETEEGASVGHRMYGIDGGAVFRSRKPSMVRIGGVCIHI